MAGATLDQIESTIFAALQSIARPNNPKGPFNFLGRWVGPPPANDASAETFGKTPSILLASEGEQIADVVTSMAAQYQFAAKSTWSILVCVSDPRGAAQVAKGSPNLLGGLALVGSVISAVNGLVVPLTTATLAFAVTGTQGATVPIGGSVLIGSPYVFTPDSDSVTLENYAPAGLVNATCTFPPGDLGNLSPGAVLTWTPPVAGLGATAQVYQSVTQGINGLAYRTGVIKYVATQRLGYVAGRVLVYGVRFTATRFTEQVAYENASQRLDAVIGNLYSIDMSDDDPSVNVTSFESFTSPANLAGIVGWWRGDGATVVNGSVTSVTDLSGNGNPFVQPTVALQPSLTTDHTPNTFPGIVFDGTGWLATADAIDLSAVTQLDVFVVYRPGVTQATGGQALLVNTTAPITTGQYAFEEMVFGATAYEGIDRGATTATTAASATPLVQPSPISILEFQHDQTGAQAPVAVLVDGVAQPMTVQQSGAPVGGFGIAPIALGRNDNATTQNLNGTVFECLIVSRLITESERAQVMQYLSRYVISGATAASTIEN